MGEVSVSQRWQDEAARNTNIELVEGVKEGEVISKEKEKDVNLEWPFLGGHIRMAILMLCWLQVLSTKRSF